MWDVGVARSSTSISWFSWDPWSLVSRPDLSLDPLRLVATSLRIGTASYFCLEVYVVGEQRYSLLGQCLHSSLVLSNCGIKELACSAFWLELAPKLCCVIILLLHSSPYSSLIYILVIHRCHLAPYFCPLFDSYSMVTCGPIHRYPERAVAHISQPIVL